MKFDEPYKRYKKARIIDKCQKTRSVPLDHRRVHRLMQKDLPHQTDIFRGRQIFTKSDNICLSLRAKRSFNISEKYCPNLKAFLE